MGLISFIKAVAYTPDKIFKVVKIYWFWIQTLVMIKRGYTKLSNQSIFPENIQYSHAVHRQMCERYDIGTISQFLHLRQVYTKIANDEHSLPAHEPAPLPGSSPRTCVVCGGWKHCGHRRRPQWLQHWHLEQDYQFSGLYAQFQTNGMFIICHLRLGRGSCGGGGGWWLCMV